MVEKESINKLAIKSGLIQGSIFAIVMAGFDYFDGNEFSIFKFCFNFMIFGIVMGFVQRYTLKKRAANNDEI